LLVCIVVKNNSVRSLLKKFFPNVIIFLGIDGSGKSTHALALASFLRSIGKNVKYVWMRRIAFFSLPLLAVSRLLGITKVRRFKDGSHWISEYPFYAYSPFKLLWPWLQLVDSLIHITFCIYFPLLFNPHIIIIIDRGIIDTLVDVTADCLSPKGYRILERLFIHSIPKNSFVIVLDVEETVAIKRKSDIPSIHFLKIRRKICRLLAKRYKWPILSTDKSFEDVHRKMLLMIRENLIC